MSQRFPPVARSSWTSRASSPGARDRTVHLEASLRTWQSATALHVTRPRALQRLGCTFARQSSAHKRGYPARVVRPANEIDADHPTFPWVIYWLELRRERRDGGPVCISQQTDRGRAGKSPSDPAQSPLCSRPYLFCGFSMPPSKCAGAWQEAIKFHISVHDITRRCAPQAAQNNTCAVDGRCQHMHATPL
eukprot:42063-Rhodomonas_salina.1